MTPVSSITTTILNGVALLVGVALALGLVRFGLWCRKRLHNWHQFKAGKQRVETYQAARRPITIPPPPSVPDTTMVRVGDVWRDAEGHCYAVCRRLPTVKVGQPTWDMVAVKPSLTSAGLGWDVLDHHVRMHRWAIDSGRWQLVATPKWELVDDKLPAS